MVCNDVLFPQPVMGTVEYTILFNILRTSDKPLLDDVDDFHSQVSAWRCLYHNEISIWPVAAPKALVWLLKRNELVH
jgi:hypothetical protein